MSDFEVFAIRLKKLRNEMGMTQKDFSEIVGCTSTTLSAYENTLKKPSLDIVRDIAVKCHVSIDWLCGLTDRESYEDKIETYTDVINVLLELQKVDGLSANFASVKSDDFNCVFIAFENEKLNRFIMDWLRINALYDDQTIDEDMFKPWLNSKLAEYDTAITQESTGHSNDFINHLVYTYGKDHVFKT